jgi:hypothetical protein
MSNNKYHSLFLMFVALGVVLLVMDDLEEYDNKQDDTEKIVADALRTVFVEAINRYNQFKRGRIDENWAHVSKRRRVASHFNWQRVQECIVQKSIKHMSNFPTKKLDFAFQSTNTKKQDRIT